LGEIWNENYTLDEYTYEDVETFYYADEKLLGNLYLCLIEGF